jgi:GMP synthase-like glutamine amidotransferase
MRIRFFQHVPFEGPGLIEPWLQSRGHTLATTRWWAGATAPAPAEYDWLIVLGGPMNVYQHRDHPWLPAEKAAIAAACATGRRVLGICLGAQLIADVLGAKIVQNPEREIGRWPLRADPVASAHRFALPGESMVLHWHGDTFTLPPGAIRLGASAACAEQAFAWGERVLGLQFHLEMDPEALGRIAEGCADELAGGGRWVQGAADLARGAREHGAAATALLHRLLLALEADVS